MNFNKKFFVIMPMFIVGMQNLIAQPQNMQQEFKDLDKALNVKYQDVGIDNSNNPITIAYVEKQNHPGKITVICSDTYLGFESWSCLIKELSKHVNVIAIDPIGSGKSSQNAPTDLDGVGGVGIIGYSYTQQAIFLHNFISALEITTPIVLVGMDPQGNVAIRYADLYKNDQYKLNKLVVVNAPPQSSVGDDPCKLRYLTVAQAQAIADLYRLDKCTALCLLLQSSFAEPACSKEATELYNEVVNFSAMQSADIFERSLVGTISEDISGLMGGITIPVLYLYSIVNIADEITRQSQGMAFTGFCPSCRNPELCSTLPYIHPFPNCQFHTFAGKGVLCNRTDAVRFNRYVKEFVLGEDLDCEICNINPNVSVICPTCP